MTHDHTSPGGRLADRLAHVRRRLFVGRESEQALFCSALESAHSSFAVLHIYGPGGMGKSSLLREFGHIAAERGRTVAYVDGRAIALHPAGFLAHLAEALQLPGQSDCLEALRAGCCDVLLIDTYEALAPLDGWLRDTLLPQMPAGMVTVIAGRNPPADGWSSDLAWRQLARRVALAPFGAAECQAFLRVHGVSEVHADVLLAATYGHPLALALFTDLLAHGAAGELELAHEPHIVRALLERFVAHAPSADHRAALEMCAHVRVTTEYLLGAVFGAERAHDLFRWLCGLSFIEAGPHGLAPHDLARDVLDAELRWRNPPAYRAMHHAARAAVLQELQAASGAAQQTAFADLLYLHRHNPVMRPYYEWRSLGSTYADTPRPDEHELICDLVEQYEGREAANIARHWLEHQFGAFHLFRTSANQTFGYVCALTLTSASFDLYPFDPALASIRRFVEQHAPLRAGEEILLQRFWSGVDHYQEPGPVHNMVAMTLGTAWLTNSRLAWAFTVAHDPAPWTPMFTYLNFERVPDADWQIGNRRYAVWAHDWRAQPAVAWLDVMAQRELQGDAAIAPPSQPQLDVLSEATFADAVRRALRDYTRPDALYQSPLLRTALVARYGPPTPDTLRSLIRTAVEQLSGNARDAKYGRALVCTYLEPTASQEQAAELLGLPFSTYRFHLTRGIARVVAWLWQREVGQPH